MTGEKGPRKPRKTQDSAPARAPSVAERVAICRRSLVAKAWDTTRASEMAEEWGVALVTVQAHAAEAQRQIEAALDPAQVRAWIDSLLLEAVDRARQEPDHARASMALTKAAALAADTAGMTRKQAGKPEPKPSDKPASGLSKFLRPQPEKPS